MENRNSQLPSYNPVGNFYSYEHLDLFLSDIQVSVGMQYEVSAGKRLTYINCPAAFDIETSSFYVDENSKSDASKVAIMYLWQFGVNGSIIYGREWWQFLHLIKVLTAKFGLSSNRRLLIYVHNLSFEFQFIKELFKWDAVFSLKARVPIYAVSGGIEFRCSYKLSNYSLDYLGSHMLHKYRVTKKTGDLDYSLIRHSKTPLKVKEIRYGLYDVYVVMSFIREKMEEEGGDISTIPLTNTGYVRRHCRDKTLESPVYRHIIDSLVVNYKEYSALKKTFMGGFTHANVEHVNHHLYAVDSYDIASDYPARICLEYFPMTKAKYQSTVSSIKELDTLLNKYCVIFKLQLYNISPLVPYENILSISRCEFLTPEDNYVANNGRLVSYPGWLETWVTEIDFKNLSEFYTWEDWAVSDLYIYERDYLPTEFVNCVLDFYENKTQLKGVPGKEVEYMVSKNMLNSTYGMMVTDIVREEALYNSTGWSKEKPDLKESIVNYNKSWNRFLFYPWGIYVTAHARNQIFTIIKKIQSDYVYSDTDSVKLLNSGQHKKVFEEYNAGIISKIFKSANHHGISPTRFMPKDPSGKTHPIGMFEFDGHYDHFKTCGAKRYLYTTDGKTGLTVAGLGKDAGLNYLIKKYGPDLDSIYSAFTDGLYVPPGSSGKLTHTYLDKPRMGVVVDYQGNSAFYHEKSATHLEPAPFCMSMLDSYLRYIYGIEEDIYRE